jgi:hypothetical protein
MVRTVEDKVNDFLRLYVDEFNNAQERALIRLLKDQDRDTRHACAEAVAFMDDDDNHDAVIGNAIRVIINTRAV